MLRLAIALFLCAVAYPAAVLLGKGSTGGALFVGTFTVFATACGVPVLAWCLRRNWYSLWHATLGGAALGAAASLPLGLFGGLIGALYFAAIFLLIGAVHGAVFWFVGIWRNSEVASLSSRLRNRARVGNSAA